METAQVCLSISEWIKELWDIYSGAKKKILPFVTVWMDLENITLSEIRPSEKDKYHYDFTHMWNLMNKLNKENGDRLIDGEQADSWVGVRGWRD